MECLHDPANVQQKSSSIITYGSKHLAIHVYFEYICWKFAGRLLDRVITPLVSDELEDLSGVFRSVSASGGLHPRYMLALCALAMPPFAKS